MAVKLKKGWLIAIFAITFLSYMSMGYLSSRDFADATMNWIVQGINTIGQGALLFGTIVLHKAGLSNLRLHNNEVVEG